MEGENYTHTQGRRQGLTPNFQSSPLTITVDACALTHKNTNIDVSCIHFMHTYVQKYFKDFLKESAKKLYH